MHGDDLVDVFEEGGCSAQRGGWLDQDRRDVPLQVGRLVHAVVGRAGGLGGRGLITSVASSSEPPWAMNPKRPRSVETSATPGWASSSANVRVGPSRPMRHRRGDRGHDDRTEDQREEPGAAVIQPDGDVVGPLLEPRAEAVPPATSLAPVSDTRSYHQ